MSDGTGPSGRVVLVSGLSGAGKASILRALEDIGYEAIDNPPLPMIEDLIRRETMREDDRSPASPPAERRIAVGVDARTRGFDAEAVLATLGRLRANPSLRPELVFAWADEAVLQRRFTETRRRHPLSPRGRVAEGIAAEQALTAPLHEGADLVLDTSDLPLGELRRLIEQRYGAETVAQASPGLAVSLISFAFPAGLPREADMVFDARFLRNPHYIAGLRPLTGLDPAVGAYVSADPDFRPFYDRVLDLLTLLLPRFVQEGKKYATVAIGCTGGRHRSVHIAETLTVDLRKSGWQVTTTHRELAREGIVPHSASGSGQNDRMLPAPRVQAQEA